MKKIYLLILFIFMVSYQGFSQVKTEKVSLDLIPAKVRQQVPSPLLLKFNNKAAVLQELEDNLVGKDIETDKLTFGKFVEFHLNFKDIEGICGNGFCYKEIEVESPGSNTLGFVFKRIELTEKAQLFIINDEELYVQGPLTKETVNYKENFISGLMPGDKLRLLLIEPKEEANQSIIEINQASHGILDFFKVNKHVSSRLQSDPCFGCSAPCTQNIKCNTYLDIESRATALQLRKLGTEYSAFGTGALINNGKQDFRPLILTAHHVSNEDFLNDMQFMFHYRSPQCLPTTMGPVTIYVQGATRPAISTQTDLAILLLKINPKNSPVFANHPVSYLGWSIIDQPITSVQGIHHPMGDIQKTFSGGPATAYFHAFNNQHQWKFDLTNGIYETNSSGSPILDQNKRIISAVRGKNSLPAFTCSPPYNDAVGGRLSKAWIEFCSLLDPNNEGIVALNTITTTAGPKVFPIASGPNSLCSTGLFTLTNAPLDLPITWQVVQGGHLLSGSPSGTGKSVSIAPISPTASGQAKIRFTVQNICGTKQYEKSFQVGIISSAETTVTGSAAVCPGNQYTYYANVPGGHKPGYAYQWTYPSNWSVQTQSANFITLYVPSNPVYGTVRFRVNNGCGYSEYSGITVFPGYSCSSGMYDVNVYPNPVSDELNLVMLGESGNEIQKENSTDQDFEISLYDVKGHQVSSFKTKETKITIDVSKIKNGFYYLHILYKEGLIRRQIRIER